MSDSLIGPLISTEELARITCVKKEDIRDYCEFFDQDPNDKWELREGEDFIWSNKKYKVRKFTKKGALEIAKYVEEKIDKKSVWRRLIKTFFNTLQKRFVRSLVMERVAEIAGNNSIVISNKKAFVNTPKTRYILRLANRQDLLIDARKYEQTGDHGREPMRPNKHWIEVSGEDGEYYSSEGIKRLSMGLQDICKSRSTKNWNSAVSDSIFQTLKAVAKPLLLDDKKMKKIMNLAKTKSGSVCELTGRKKSADNLKFQLAAHHLYDKSSYPIIRYEIHNVIAIDEELHKAFHAYMGGSKKSCTAEDFLEWLKVQSHEIFRGCEDEVACEASAISNVKRRIQFLHSVLD